MKRRLQTRQRLFYCRAHSHIRIMVGRAGAEKSAPVPFPGYANPVRLTTSLIGVNGGDNPNRKGISHEHISRTFHRSPESFFQRWPPGHHLPIRR
ncbi:ash family protein [Enterobacter hormaechei]|nr:hypothetical protein B1023_10445 [Enterobacter hormaechei]EHN8798461.1 ash family protein [Enterobacter hormaechei]MBG0518090.1 ash family protein [Enterobacter hormaechei]MBK4413321.1 ash family protein [Enterobacter hormaechei]MBL6040161.1 ash family protein [Enterobacter hormaechei]